MTITNNLKNIDGSDIEKLTMRNFLMGTLMSANRLIDLESDDFSTIFRLQMKVNSLENPEFDSQERVLFGKLFKSDKNKENLWLIQQALTFIGDEKCLKIRAEFGENV